MLEITSHQLNQCISKAQEVQSKYEGWVAGGPDFPRSVDLLGDVCVRDLERNIRVYDMEGVEDEIKKLFPGVCVVNKDDFEIYIHPNLNTCWTRFVLTKELFQVLLDGAEYRSMDLNKHLEQLLIRVPENKYQDDDEVHLPGSSEIITQIAAMEFLFPYSERKKIRAQENVSLMDVANHYRIPKSFANWFLSDPLMQHLEQFSK